MPKTTAADRLRTADLTDDDPQTLDVPGGPAGNGAPTQPPADGAGAQADPPLAPAVPDAAGGLPQPASEQDGAGRPSTTDGQLERRSLDASKARIQFGRQQQRDADAATDNAAIERLDGLVERAIAARDHDGYRDLVPMDLIGEFVAVGRQWAAMRGVNGA